MTFNYCLYLLIIKLYNCNADYVGGYRGYYCETDGNSVKMSCIPLFCGTLLYFTEMHYDCPNFKSLQIFLSPPFLHHIPLFVWHGPLHMIVSTITLSNSLLRLYVNNGRVSERSNMNDDGRLLAQHNELHLMKLDKHSLRWTNVWTGWLTGNNRRGSVDFAKTEGWRQILKPPLTGYFNLYRKTSHGNHGRGQIVELTHSSST